MVGSQPHQYSDPTGMVIEVSDPFLSHHLDNLRAHPLAGILIRELERSPYRIVLAQGRDPDFALVKDVLAAGIPCFTIGDSRRTGRIGNAVHDAHKAIRTIAAERVVPRELAC